MTNSNPRERGSALVLAMLLVVVLTAVTSALSSSVRRTAHRTVLDFGRIDALAAAEAGVELARVRLADDPAWSGDTIEVGRSLVIVQVAPLPDGRRQVVADATTRPAGDQGLVVVRRVGAVLEAPMGRLPIVVSWSDTGG